MARLIVLLALVGWLCPARAEVSLVRVWPQWRGAEDFKRISEYFDGRENTGGRIIRRSQPASRAGYYFLTRVRHPGLSLAGASFILRVVTPSSPEVREYAFSADAGPGEQVFELGLTGTDWAGKKVHPVAWRLELRSAAGQTLASAQSFLWARPEH